LQIRLAGQVVKLVGTDISIGTRGCYWREEPRKDKYFIAKFHMKGEPWFVAVRR
jgi:hypothetical protein